MGDFRESPNFFSNKTKVISMKNFMNTVKIATPMTNMFDLSFDEKTSMNLGYLYPSPPIECVPGDVWRIGSQSLVRAAPMVAPVMHRYDIRHEYFFVPNRILWPAWDEFITQTEVGGSIPAHPYINLAPVHATNFPIVNHMGLPTLMSNPTAITPTEKISALPFFAYSKIWNDYYRDQNLMPEIPVVAVNGDNAVYATDLFTLRKRAWEKDYFTSCLPFAQKGDPVMIPIGSQNVVVDPAVMATQGALWKDAVNAVLPGQDIQTSAAVGFEGTSIGTPAGVNAYYDPNGTLVTEDGGEATSINDLRLAYALQKVKEKLARGGSRLTEFLRVVFGVVPQDARLDRPEYITGVKSPLSISEVLQTSSTDAETPQGNMAGHGVGVVSGYKGHYKVYEHGYIICMNSIIPRTAYQQGINKTWLRTEDPVDYYLPDMANIGEQTVKNREIFAFQGAASDDDFGYQARFGEYKTMPSFVTGQMRTTYNFWQHGRIFATPPALNATFINCTPDYRVFAVTDEDEDHYFVHIYHQLKVVRKMPKFGTPTY